MIDHLKYPLINARATIAEILACIAFLSIAACTTAGSSSQAEAPSEPPANVDAIKDLSFFDSIVTPEVVFPDPAVRALYQAYPPSTTEYKDQASTFYTFSLIQRPGMDPDSDAHYIHVLLSCMPTRAEAFPAARHHHNEGIAGRKDEHIEFVMPLPGGRYSLSVSSDMRLSDMVDVPEFDPESTAKRLRLHYLRNLNKLNKQLPKLLSEASPTLPASAAIAKDLSFFDSIVTPEVVFPNPTARALYKKNPVQTQPGWRGYSFTPIRQPGMGDRDFHVISVVWSPAGTLNQGTQVFAGPEGNTIDFVTRTPDGIYDLRVTEIVQLPDGIDEPEFDPIFTAERLLLHYLHYLQKRLSFFDSIVTPEVVFPDPTTRALYEALPPGTTEEGWRVYSFALNQQSKMDDRDFNFITVTWAPAGTFRQGIGGTGGPGGGFVDFVTRTSDDIYDLRISKAMLLTIGVNAPEFNIDSAAKRLLLQYSRNSSKQQTIER
jgi:hypothetical protein